MAAWGSEWARQKCNLALSLSSGKCGGAYSEAVLILCAALNALAADVWPSERIDRKRFVELLKRFSPGTLSPTQISVPLLCASLRRRRKKRPAKPATARKMAQMYLDFEHARVIVGSEVDTSEREILKLFPNLTKEEVRACSYANLLYTELRSGYAHEYRPGKRADSFPMTTRKDAQISYVNCLDARDRQIHFHMTWLSQLVIETAKAIDALPSRIPARKPKRWWVDG